MARQRDKERESGKMRGGERWEHVRPIKNFSTFFFDDWDITAISGLLYGLLLICECSKMCENTRVVQTLS